MGRAAGPAESGALYARSGSGGNVRRRTKPRVVWLPQTNANSIGDGSQVYQGIVQAPSGPTGNHAITEIPLVADVQLEADSAAVISLSDIESSGYQLRRIVGKVWVVCSQSALEVDAPASCIVTAGIMVRRADSTTGKSLGDLASLTEVQIDPSTIDNTGDPWVWRRSWLLGNNTVLTNATVDPITNAFIELNSLPESNMEYGSVSDGPHIDQKTARIVGPEERLFMTFSTTILNEAANPGLNEVINVGIFTDLRVLGSLRTNAGNRRNANR